MEPFDVLSMGNFSDFHLEPSNLHFFQFFKFAHGFSAKMGFEKYAPGPEILAKASKIMQVWFGDLNFGKFWFISREMVHIFQNRFLR